MALNNQFQQPIFQPYPTNNYSFQNQQPQQMASPLNPSSSITWVIGQAGAEAHPVVPGVEAAFFDSTAPVVYFKKIGLDGKPEYLKTYDMVLREDKPEDKTPQVDLSKYITRDEFIDLVTATTRAEIEKAMSEVSLKPSTKKKKGDDE